MIREAILDALPLLILLLALSALFSGSETAFFSLSHAEVANLRRRGASGRGAAALAERPNDLLAALLIGNITVNTGTGVLTTTTCLELFGPKGLAIAVPVATILLLLVGEITPKLVALGRRQQLVVLVQAPLRVWVALVSPVVRLLTRALESGLRRIPAERTGSRPLATQELQTACDLAVEDATLTLTEGRSLARLLALRDLEVRQIMVPRPDVVTIDGNWDRRRILAAVLEAGYNRFPVMGDDSNHPVGLFHVKDLLNRPGDPYPLAGPQRPLPVVPESKDVASLLAEMRTGAGHMAAVVDEHGDFAGIVTLADCLQALIGRVGDIARRRPLVVPMGDQRWVVGGRLDLRALSEATGVELPPSRDYVTVAGFVMARLGRVPSPGDRVVMGNAVLEVLVMQGNRIDALQVMRVAPDDDAGGEP
jgi:putative hemolysin